MRIAILGATGHVAKCALLAFSGNEENEFFLFSRRKPQLERFLRCGFPGLNVKCFHGYDAFHEFSYDLIFNGIGIWDNPGGETADVFFVTEHYDDMVIRYQKMHPDSVSIHVSSGAVYANDFSEPAEDGTRTAVRINALSPGDSYSVAKINAEAKHRALGEYGMVDIRLFGFFSRYMSLDYPYLLSGLINSVKEKRTFRTISADFWRDYIHMEDFAALLNGIAQCKKINTAIDVRSKAPISKNELIRMFTEKYGLIAEIDDESVTVSKTGVKPRYYSRRDTPLYEPRFTSRETVEEELAYFFKGGRHDD